MRCSGAKLHGSSYELAFYNNIEKDSSAKPAAYKNFPPEETLATWQCAWRSICSGKRKQKACNTP